MADCRNKYRPLANQKGVAMMMAMITMTVLGILAAQLVYDTEVYHRIVFNNIDKLRSRYLAKSALRLGILQLHAADKAREKAKSLGGGDLISEETLEMIWNTPIILPAPIPPDSDGFEKGAITEFNKTLGLEGRFSVSIQGQSDKFNLNEMVWVETGTARAPAVNPSGSKPGTGASSPTTPTTPALTAEQTKQKLESRRKAYSDLLKQLIDDQKTADEKFERKYSNVNAETLINNIVAWIDSNAEEDGDRRPKEEYYRSAKPPYGIKNAPLFSMSEIHMIKGFDEQLAKIMHENFTATITDGIHINTASRSLLRALIPTLTDRDLDAIVTHRDESPFKNADDFWKFLGTLGDFANAQKELTDKGIKLTSAETAYRVLVEASSGQSTRSWQANVGSLPPEIKAPVDSAADGSGDRLGGAKGGEEIDPQTGLPRTNPADAANPGGAADSAKADSAKTPNILYLKSD